MSQVWISDQIDKERLQYLSNTLLQSPDGVISEWCCELVSIENRNFVTGGVYRVSGRSHLGEGVCRSWSVILKIVNEDAKRNDPAHYNYWKREIMTYRSGLLMNLPGNIKAPECFAIDERENGSVWLWLEDLPHEPRQWEWQDYAYTTGKLGEFQAAYLLDEPLPEYEWVNRHWMRSWINECYAYRYNPNECSKNLLYAQKEVADIMKQFNIVEDSVDAWLTTLDQLPRTFAHQDFYEQNIMLNTEQQQEGKLTLIDWQFASISGIGEDLGRFLGLTISRGQVPIEHFVSYKELFLSSYIEGMRRAGWHGNENVPRFGCLAAFALRSVWEVPKLLKKLEQNPCSLESQKLLLIAQLQMEAAQEVERLREEIYMD